MTKAEKCNFCHCLSKIVTEPVVKIRRPERYANDNNMTNTPALYACKFIAQSQNVLDAYMDSLMGGMYSAATGLRLAWKTYV